MTAEESPVAIFLIKVAIEEQMPGRWIVVMSSSTSAISARIA